MDLNDKVKFESYHIPAVKPGFYSIEQNIVVEKTVAGNADEVFATPPKYFYVGGERYLIPPDQIFSVFPPAKSIGDHGNVMPHIELTRSTLPWERDNKTNNTANVPWLGLVLLDESEMADSTKIKMEKMTWADYRDFLNKNSSILEAEPGDSDAADAGQPSQVSVLWGKPDFLKSILPREGDLKSLAHIRSGYSKGGKPFERAVLVCNRMPKPGRKSTVHLVSFEHRFPTGAYTETGTIDIANGVRTSDGFIPLICLYTWDFACTNEVLFKGETFKGLLAHLDQAAFRLPAKDNRIPADAEKYLQAGSLPLPHQLRGGGKTVSWFRGPLVPVGGLTKNLDLKMPVRNADQLLYFNQQLGMLDVSYASAWELGRLLSLSDPSRSLKIQEWKSSLAHEVGHEEQVLVHGHLPFLDRAFGNDPTTELSQTLQNYFSRLNLLGGVPFHYLVPDESYLPTESIRFFQIDPLWVEALLDGAFSIGRHTDLDLAKETKQEKLPSTAKYPILSGVLIRSALVSGWPAMQVDGYDEVIEADKTIPELDALTNAEITVDVQALMDQMNQQILPDIIKNKINASPNKPATLSADLTLNREREFAWQLIDNKNLEYYLIQAEGDGESRKLKIYDENKMPILRMERLSPNVLLCIFQGIVKTVDVHLPAEGLHFGFVEPDADHKDYFKELKSLDNGQELMNAGSNIVADIQWVVKELRVVDTVKLSNAIQEVAEIKAFVADAKKKDPNAGFGSGHFAIEMLEGVTRGRFVLKQ